jgi:hypothetical protein
VSRAGRPVVLRAAGLLGLALSGAAAAAPSDRDMAHCASIDAPDGRLACYDNLAHRPGAATAAAVAPAPAPLVASPARAAAPTAATVGAAPAVMSTPSPAAAAPTDTGGFGLNKAQLHVAPEGPSSITALVTNVNQDARGQTYVRLDNGQTWTTTEPDLWLGPGESVTIKRATLGSFLMVTTSKHSYRVRRTH